MLSINNFNKVYKLLADNAVVTSLYKGRAIIDRGIDAAIERIYSWVWTSRETKAQLRNPKKTKVTYFNTESRERERYSKPDIQSVIAQLSSYKRAGKKKAPSLYDRSAGKGRPDGIPRVLARKLANLICRFYAEFFPSFRQAHQLPEKKGAGKKNQSRGVDEARAIQYFDLLIFTNLCTPCPAAQSNL